jgi:GLPGLI family protein
MYKIMGTLGLIFLTYLGANAQSFQGMAVYESKTSTAEFKNRMAGNRNVTPEMQKNMEEGMKAMFEKTFLLNFDKAASIYKEEERLEGPAQGGGMRFMMSMTGGGGTLYKNVKEKYYSIDKDLMGKEFLVKDSLSSLNWKMESETRVIGGYNCFKATAVIPVSQSDFRNLRSRRDDDKTATADKKEDKEKKTNFMDNLEMPKDKIVTAWYTPEIPVNQGPDKYWGLPGLILEVNDGTTVILCSKVVLNPKTKTEIKAPTKGKVISQKEFDETSLKKMQEMREMYQGRGGNGGGQFRIGQ